MKKVVKKTKKKEECCKDWNMKGCGSGNGACGGMIYVLGFIGSVVYYISTAGSFGAGFIGVLKSIVWPAFLIFESFKFLGM
jgi:hypothetical protein